MAFNLCVHYTIVKVFATEDLKFLDTTVLPRTVSAGKRGLIERGVVRLFCCI